jgi:hypothetical protein
VNGVLRPLQGTRQFVALGLQLEHQSAQAFGILGQRISIRHRKPKGAQIRSLFTLFSEPKSLFRYI